ncbi:hypothetical protein X946_5233 [Burkholderia sp. ABCPW 111]|nr:hypothetical protein X946_5233 [Burkholderia sp. ABCPW 111]
MLVFAIVISGDSTGDAGVQPACGERPCTWIVVVAPVVLFQKASAVAARSTMGKARALLQLHGRSNEMATIYLHDESICFSQAIDAAARSQKK